eukprot:c40376_g1_i1.p1 GENE.c40376_g1_i1~~c40376_g1_i1.p1  ORF type:complete len:825 (+),score=136.89 c40376_g1_i1:266-2476(+)
MGICKNGFCECQLGIGGACCDVVYPPCPGNCSGAGLCELILWDSQSTCVCLPGSETVGCGMKDSGCPNQCSGHGYCRNGKCECQHGMVGESCSLATRCPGDCAGAGGRDGTCFQGKCICPEGYSGPDCRIKDGNIAGVCPRECCGRGECVYSKEYRKYYCICPSGTGGQDCCESYCPKDCSYRGSCIGGRCQCDAGWQGVSCDEPVVYCPGDPSHDKYPGKKSCSGVGVCNAGTCVCPVSKFKCTDGKCQVLTRGYIGPACEQMDCPRNCLDIYNYRTPFLRGLDFEPSHGTCNTTIGKCKCTDYWKGHDCSIPRNVWEPELYASSTRPIGRHKFAAVVRGANKLIVYGGYTFRRCPIQRQYPCDFQLGDMWEYDMTTQLWAPIKYQQVYDDLPRERAGHAAVLVAPQEYMVMFGGTSNDIREDSHIIHKDTWLFNFETGLWHRFPIIEPGDLARFGHSMLARDLTVLLLFGDGFDGYKKSAFVFNLETEVWTRVEFVGDQIPEPRTRAAVTRLGDQIYVFGGLGNGGALADVFVGKWPCASGVPIEWSQLTIVGEMPPPRWGASLMNRLDSVFMFGGELDEKYRWTYLDDLWEFSTTEKVWKQMKPWYWQETGTPLGREGHVSFYHNSTQFERLLIFGGHNYARVQNSGETDTTTLQNYRSDMWAYKLRRASSDAKAPCSDCDPASRACTAAIDSSKTAELEQATHAHHQMLLDPGERAVDDSYKRANVNLDDND